MTSGVKAALFAATLLPLSACATTSSPDFRTEAAPGFSTANVSSFEWAFEGVPMGTGNALVYERVRQSLASSLQNSGIANVPAGEGDIVVAFTIGSREDIQVTDWGPVGTYWPRYGRNYGYGWSLNYSDVDIRTVTEGSLAVDIFDGETKRPVWQGIASERLARSGVTEEQILAATSGLVERFIGSD